MTHCSVRKCGEKSRSKSLRTIHFLNAALCSFYLNPTEHQQIARMVRPPAWNLEIVHRSNISKSGEDQTGRVLLVKRFLGIPHWIINIECHDIHGKSHETSRITTVPSLIQGASLSLEVVIQVMPFSESMDPIPNQPQAITCSKSIMPIMINTKLNWMDATYQMSIPFTGSESDSSRISYPGYL